MFTWTSRDDLLYALDPLLGLPSRPRVEVDAAAQVRKEDRVAVAGVAEAGADLEVWRKFESITTKIAWEIA